MTRLLTAGAEANHIHVDGIVPAGTVPIVSSPVRSGNYAYSMSYSVSGNNMPINWTGVSGRWFYTRMWFRSTGLPSSARQIALIYQTTISLRTIYQHPDGTLSSSATYGQTPHSVPVPIDEWHCFEIGVMSNGSSFFWDLRLDGTQFSSLSISVSQIVNRIRFGTVGVPTDPSTMYIDDIALNDDQGSNQNFWPDVRGQIALITPSSDQAVGANWLLGQGAAPAGLAYDSVNNLPPIGVANNVAGADPKQIRNAIASVTQPAADVDLKCLSYSSVVPDGHVVKVLTAIFELGHSSGSVTSNIDVGLIANPSQVPVNVLIPAGATGSFTTFWNRIAADVIYNPSVVRSDEAVLRIGRRTVTALTQMCCFAGLMLEYEPIPLDSGQRFLAVA